MANQIVNAAPMVIQRGTQDLSTVPLPILPEAIPQHLPKFYMYAQKGPLTPQLVVGQSMVNMYGSETFDLRKQYANHATVFIDAINAEANMMMLQRLIPQDAGPAATINLSLDVLPTTVNQYQRNSDGSIYLSPTGQPNVTGSVNGFKVKWVFSYNAAAAPLGTLTMGTGSQVDPTTGLTSSLYPIFQFEVSSPGNYGNNRAIRLWAPTLVSDPSMDTNILINNRAYPIYLSVYGRPNSRTAPSIVSTLTGNNQVTSVYAPGVIDTLTDQELYVQQNFINSYQNIGQPGVPNAYGDFGSMYTYQANIDLLLAQFFAAEVPFITAYTDFTNSIEDMYMFNMISGMNSSGAPYTTFQLVDDSNSVRLTNYANIYAKGGSDGTMNDALFDQLVSAAVSQYGDPQSPLMDTATNVESIMYDTGFSLSTKQAMTNFIAVRKDTFLTLSTFTSFNDGGQQLTEAEENSIAIGLRTQLQMYPESNYFGTPVMRAIIIGRNGKLLNSTWPNRVPLTYELAIKSARYMGAADGKWASGEDFDCAPGSVLNSMYDVNITFVSDTNRNNDWDVGLNWVQAYDRSSLFFPALKTVYDNDTSVLNSYFVALAIGQLNKVAHAAWRQFSGVEHLTNAQLADAVNIFVNDNVKGRFDGRYIIVPNTLFTEMDVLRGYSWTLPIEIYAPNMKTVMTTYVQAYRIGSYTGPTATPSSSVSISTSANNTSTAAANPGA
jgi:hypothetical protein